MALHPGTCQFCNNVAERVTVVEDRQVRHCHNCTARGPKPVIFIETPSAVVDYSPEEIDRMQSQLGAVIPDYRFVVLQPGMQTTAPLAPAYSITEKMGEYEYTMTFRTKTELLEWVAIGKTGKEAAAEILAKTRMSEAPLEELPKEKPPEEPPKRGREFI